MSGQARRRVCANIAGLSQGTTLDSNTRLRIASRIHFALLRHLGEGIDVALMLKSDDYAREALWVCEAIGSAELTALARQFQAGMPAATRAA